MFDLCLFDLDNTLVRTNDLEDIRPKGVGKQGDIAYAAELRQRFGDPALRYIYAPEHLNALKARWPDMKMGIFTRAPRAYADVVVGSAYPHFKWDVGVCYDDVPPGLWKPNGEGIRMAMRSMGIVAPQSVVMVGDESADVKAAYNAGCYTVLDKAAWPDDWRQWDNTKHWDALKLLPDAVLGFPKTLHQVLEDIEAYALPLEWEFNNSLGRARHPSFELINHFYPHEMGEGKVPVKISVAGRHFSEYASLQSRRAWHALTQSLHANKTSQVFPVQWCNTVNAFVRDSFPALLLLNQSVTVAAIPARPTRPPRLQYFVEQLRQYFLQRPALGPNHGAVQFSNALLSYRDGVKSQSGDHLNRLQRFENVRDHLVVTDPANVRGRDFVIIDDVCTTGATLMYAHKRLKEAGARNVVLLALSKNVSDVLP
ncbi:HAD hydrolase-like protein [Xanthomonas campestris pv. campestris]|uniref:HAD hydrolase-like protein n=1 Tax=Xanthomonas campestris TaxID=339 RepID=UPI00265C5453|nr:HAD hydrolase-like protein [Xanthomonas campestris]MDO0787993.1 HAD hydrolase-like protein [Xanthomonas campestris pv. campestris]